MRPQPDTGFAIWLTGLPAAGKSTLARALKDLLAEKRIRVQILDSDELRRILTPQPSYSDAERDWFYDVVTYIAGLLTDNGVNVLIAATGARRAYRQAARRGIARFAEVHVVCPPEVCRARDPKGLWERADAGEITTLPGAGVPYEAPETPEVVVNTAKLRPTEAAEETLRRLDQTGFLATADPRSHDGT